MDIQLRDLGHHKILEIDGDVDLYNVAELKQTIFRLIDAGDVKSLVVDLKKVAYMDSAGIGALVAGHKKMKSQGGRFALLNLQEDVLAILRLATLDKFFTIYTNEAELENPT